MSFSADALTVLRLVKRIDAAVADKRSDELLEVLTALSSASMSVECLKTTKVGAVVNRLRAYDDVEVAEMAKVLVFKWKAVAAKALGGARPSAPFNGAGKSGDEDVALVAMAPTAVAAMDAAVAGTAAAVGGAGTGTVGAVPPACLCARYRMERSWNGFRTDVLKSALQKYVRRGEVDRALWAAGELDLFKHAPDDRAETVRTNFIHRLMVIWLEDVGVGALETWPQVDGLISSLLRERKKLVAGAGGGGRDMRQEEAWVGQAVTIMCAAQKTRACSHARAVSNTDALTLEVLSKHHPAWHAVHQAVKATAATSPGAPAAKMQFWSAQLEAALRARKWEAVWWARCIAESNIAVSEYGRRKPVWRVFALLDRVGAQGVAIAMRWYQEIEGMAEGFCCWLLPLVAHVIGVKAASPVPPLPAASAAGWDGNRAGVVLALDDYVLDKHTAVGRHKGPAEFALVGAWVATASPWTQYDQKTAYEDIKVAQQYGIAALMAAGVYSSVVTCAASSPGGVVGGASSSAAASGTMSAGAATGGAGTDSSLASIHVAGTGSGSGATASCSPAAGGAATPATETGAFAFIVRAQLNTGVSKSDVYFARDNSNGALVVVKGPVSAAGAANAVEVAAWKAAMGIPAQRLRVAKLLPNRWSEGVPLGLRNSLPRDVPATFLIAESLLPEPTLANTVLRESKLWPKTAVVDWTKVSLHVKPLELTGLAARDYVAALAVRYLWGISDIADRNILMTLEGRVVSVDEEYRGKDIDFRVELKRERCAWVAKWLAGDGNFESIGTAGWTVPKELEARLVVVQDRTAFRSLFV